jgi:hypothetical protein
MALTPGPRLRAVEPALLRFARSALLGRFADAGEGGERQVRKTALLGRS